GDILGRSFVRTRSMGRRTRFENIVQSQWARRVAFAEYEGRNLRHFQIETIQHVGGRKWVDRTWIRLDRAGWTITRSKLGESWTHVLERRQPLAIFSTDLVFPFFFLPSERKNTLWERCVAYNTDGLRIEELSVRRTTKNKSPIFVEFQIQHQDLSG